MAKQLDYHTIRQIFERFEAAAAEPKGELNHVNVYTLVVAVALSAQATDAGVNKATEKLFQIADTPQKMLDLGEEGVIEHIKTIGLYRNKAKNVIKLSKILVDDYGGVVPNSRAALQSLPGVGRKTANVVLCGGSFQLRRLIHIFFGLETVLGLLLAKMWMRLNARSKITFQRIFNYMRIIG
jgi:endonuclease-3